MLREDDFMMQTCHFFVQNCFSGGQRRQGALTAEHAEKALWAAVRRGEVCSLILEVGRFFRLMTGFKAVDEMFTTKDAKDGGYYFYTLQTA